MLRLVNSSWPFAILFGIASIVGAGRLFAQTPSATEQPASGCVHSFELAQELRDRLEYLATRDQLLVCGQSHCPQPVALKCRQWLHELDQAIPSVVITARDQQGNDTIAVRLYVDGKLWRQQLDPRPLQLDPGQHRLRFELAGAPAIEKTIELSAGELHRQLVISFAPPGEHGPSSKPRTGTESQDTSPVNPLVYVGFGLGGAALLVGTITGIVTLVNTPELEQQCAELGCNQDEIDKVMTVAHVSTASFAVAGVGVGLGVLGLLLPTNMPNTEGRDSTANGGATRPAIRPLIGPTFWGLTGRF